MATHKVPQDVEADDKLLGPFTFRQFIYLMVVFGLVMLAVGLFQIFPLLVIIPLPFIIFFTVLALPLKKDQPMETYVAALVSFYTKPNRRYWVPGQSESTIQITAPKKVEAPRARNITQDEASHRLSFLADIVDSEGRSIKNTNSIMRDDLYAEASNTADMFDYNNTENYALNQMINQQQIEHRAAVVNQMRDAIKRLGYSAMSADNNAPVHLAGQRVIQPRSHQVSPSQQPAQPTPQIPQLPTAQPTTTPVAPTPANPTTQQPSVPTPPSTTPTPPANKEVYISLH